ncbi:proline-rich protein 36-like isoform X2 [Papaver somniferum]|uniref:proline-rich protein 36-like isoform X2 n=1 Tax=Papaver somniferum TaxID=3469 RepID=UPI000E7021C9|nr:proline-rich protein 36-like isoform X2 [Papaver somniferum]
MATKVDQASSVEPHRAQTTVMATSSVASASTPKVSMFIKKAGFVIPKNKLAGSLVPAIRPRKTEARDAAKVEDNKQIKRKTKWGADLSEDAAVRKGRALAYQMEKLEMLALEKQEIIGEILKLNPSYKVPPDYKPLLKEAKIPIPVTRYPGYNFVGVILGPGSHTQKRLEEETGATIQIHGTKVGTGEKGETTSSDGNDVQIAYEELYVHVSADSFEKIDAAVSLIELLISPVLHGNSATATTDTATGTGNSVNVFDQNQKDAVSSAGYVVPMAGVNHGFMQPMAGPSQSGRTQVQFQPYHGPWFPLGPPQPAVHPHSGYAPSSHMSNAVQCRPTSINTSTVHPSFSGHSQRPFIPGQPQPMQSLQQSYMPELRQQSQGFPMLNNPMQSQQNSPAFRAMAPQPNSAMPHQNTGNRPISTGTFSYPSLQHASMRPLTGRPVTPSGSSVGWSGVSPAASTSQGISSMMRINHPMGPPSEGRSPYPPPSNVPSFTSASTPSSIAEPTLGSTQLHVPPALSLSQLQQGSILLPVTTPRPQRPNSGDFTFRPLVPPPQASPGSPSLAPQMLPRPTTLQTSPTQLPSYRPAMNNSSLQVSILSNQSPRAAYQVGQPQALVSFGANTAQIPQPQLRFPAFPNPNPMLTSQIPHQGLQMPNSPGNLPPPRTVNHLQLQQNKFGVTIPSGNLFVQTQQISNNMQGFSPGVWNQGYDPFSPTAVPSSALLNQREDLARKPGS